MTIASREGLPKPREEFDALYCNFSDPRLNSGGDVRSLGGPAVACFGFQLQRPKFRINYVSVSVPGPIAGAGLLGLIFANGRRLLG